MIRSDVCAAPHRQKLSNFSGLHRSVTQLSLQAPRQGIAWHGSGKLLYGMGQSAAHRRRQRGLTAGRTQDMTRTGLGATGTVRYLRHAVTCHVYAVMASRRTEKRTMGALQVEWLVTHARHERAHFEPVSVEVRCDGIGGRRRERCGGHGARIRNRHIAEVCGDPR